VQVDVLFHGGARLTSASPDSYNRLRWLTLHVSSGNPAAAFDRGATTASSACVYVASPVLATTSTSRLSRKTLKRLQTTSGDHHRTCRLRASRECQLRQASVGSVNIIPLQLRENEIEVACQALSCSMHMLVVRARS
jgi:hypothetical protein